MAIKLIISDIDGCISPEESIPWNHEQFHEFTQKVRSANNGENCIAPVTLCTGRPQPYVEVLMKLFDIKHPAICENGAVIYSLSDNRSRFLSPITRDMIHGLRKVREFIEDEVIPDYDDVFLQFGKEAMVSVFSTDPEVFDKIESRVEDFNSDNYGPELGMSASHCYLNIFLAGVDKGEAVRYLLQKLNLNKNEVAGIGDTIGDLVLRDNVGFFACPANAQSEILDVTDYVSDYPDLEGMLDILNLKELHAE